MLLCVALLLGTTSCKQGYYKEEGKVWYYEWTTLTGQVRTELDSADYDTFDDLADEYAHDQYRAWFRKDPILGADGAHFRTLKHYYAADRQHVYFRGSLVRGAEASSFRIFREGVSRDANDYYVDSIALCVAHPDRFEFTGRGSDWDTMWGSDGEYAYYLGVHSLPVRNQPLADPATFHALVPKDVDHGSYHYACDRYRVYFRDTLILGADAATFELVRWDIARDKDHVYAQQYRLPDVVHLPSLRILRSGLFADSLHVYDRDSLLEGIDPNKFNPYQYPDGDYIREDEVEDATDSVEPG